MATARFAKPGPWPGRLPEWRDALWAALGVPAQAHSWWQARSMAETIAIARFAVYSGLASTSCCGPRRNPTRSPGYFDMSQ